MCKKSGNAVTLDSGRLHSIAGFMATSVGNLMSDAPTGLPPSALEELVLNCFDKIREQAEAKLAAQRAPKAHADQIDQALQCATPSPAGDPPTERPKRRPHRDHTRTWDRTRRTPRATQGIPRAGSTGPTCRASSRRSMARGRHPSSARSAWATPIRIAPSQASRMSPPWRARRRSRGSRGSPPPIPRRMRPPHGGWGTPAGRPSATHAGPSPGMPNASATSARETPPRMGWRMRTCEPAPGDPHRRSGHPTHPSNRRS